MVDMKEHDDAPLGYLLSRAVTKLRAEVTDGLRPLGLTFPQYIGMRLLSATPGMSSAELARAVNVSPQAMNTVLRRLEDIGAVSRPPSVPLGRALPARLTTAGATLLERTDVVVQRAEAVALSRLTKDERRELKRMLASAGTDSTEQAEFSGRAGASTGRRA